MGQTNGIVDDVNPAHDSDTPQPWIYLAGLGASPG
jgi:hypothetical protein